MSSKLKNDMQIPCKYAKHSPLLEKQDYTCTAGRAEQRSAVFGLSQAPGGQGRPPVQRWEI